jgi:hypothetical protein
VWNKSGERRLPRERELLPALSACTRDDLWWVCETNSAGPVYLLPTTEWIAALRDTLASLKAKRVVEIGAGDGFLARSLGGVIATDSGAWRSASARMNARDHRAMKDVPLAGIRGHDVVKMSATAAVNKLRPDVVLVSWAPPGLMVERAIRGPCRYVLDIGVDGDVCGNGMKTWRFHKDFLDGPVETRALCRLGAGATRVTAYYGKRHRDFGVDHGMIW